AFVDVTLERRFQQFTQKFENDRLAERAQSVKQERDAQRASVIAKRKFSDDQVKEVEKIIAHYNLPDWEAAADIYAQRNPPENPELKPPPEIEHGGATWEFPTVPGADGKMMSFADFRKNTDAATRSAAIRVIQEFKRNRLPGAFHNNAA